MNRKVFTFLLSLLFLFNEQIFAQFKFEKVKFEELRNEQDFNLFLGKSKRENKYSLIAFIYQPLTDDIKFLDRIDNCLKQEFKNDSVINFLNAHFNCAYTRYKVYDNIWSEDNLFIDKIVKGSKIIQSPTFLLIDTLDKIVHKGLEKYCSANSHLFLTELSNILDTNYQCYTILTKFENGNTDTLLTKRLFYLLNSAGDSTDEFVYDYINSQKNIYTKTNADILLHSYSHFAAFNHLYQNHDEWIKILDEKILDSFYRKSIYKIAQDAYYYVYRFDISSENLINTISSQYPRYGRLQTILFLLNQSLPVDNNKNIFTNLILNHVDDNLMRLMSAAEMNALAWKIFLNSTNKNALSIASNFSKQSLVIEEKNHYFLDTYANILYKLGKKEEAIEAERKAIENADEKNKILYEKTLQQIIANQKTW